MLRQEDPALLTGEAKYTDDLAIPGALHLAVLRSPYAHARITRVDRRPRAAMPGVVAVLHRRRPRATLWAAPMPCAWPVTDGHEEPAALPARDRQGRATSATASRSCWPRTRRRGRATPLDAIVVDYEPLPAVIDLEDALADRVARPRRPRHQPLATRGS